MIGSLGIQLPPPPPPVSAAFRHYPPIQCRLTKQGERLLTAIAAADAPSGAIGLLRKFVASSSKHVTLTTLNHILSPSTANPRLSYLAFPLYSMIQRESWFQWNAKLEADLIALLHKEERFDEADTLFTEVVLKLGSKERDLCLFHCNLVDSHAKHKSERGVFDCCTQLRQLILSSSSVYVKQRGYESMVAGFCEMGLPDKAESLIDEMRENGLKPSVFELRSLVYGYGQKGFLEEMKRIVVQMENEGFELDTVCCNMVLSSFGAHNELVDMLSWLKKMRNLGVPFSARTYNSVLKSCPTIITFLEDMRNLPLSIDELVGSLKTSDETNLVMELLKSNVLDQVMEWKESELKLDLHGMHFSSAYLILLQWFEELKVRFSVGDTTTPNDVLVVCGVGKHSPKRGESPVRNLAKEVVMRMKCPLRIDRKNIGCYIGKGKKIKEWLCREDANKYYLSSENMKAKI